VARALVHRPAVVWADEPTGNLDTESTEAVMDLLVRTNAGGQTIVLVTHNPAVAARAARTVRLRDGRIDRPVPEGRTPRRRLDPSRFLRAIRSAWGPADAEG
jgi:putative ABC transport system ATP-binding protein